MLKLTTNTKHRAASLRQLSFLFYSPNNNTHTTWQWQTPWAALADCNGHPHLCNNQGCVENWKLVQIRFLNTEPSKNLTYVQNETARNP